VRSTTSPVFSGEAELGRLPQPYQLAPWWRLGNLRATLQVILVRRYVGTRPQDSGNSTPGADVNWQENGNMQSQRVYMSKNDILSCTLNDMRSMLAKKDDARVQS